MKVGIIGAGKVGTTLGLALRDTDSRVVAVASRSLTSALALAGRLQCEATSAQGVADAADLVFLTTPDDAIADVAGGIRWRRGQGVVHCSGATPVEALARARDAGASTGGFHPLQTFATPDEALARLPGTRFGIEADEPFFGELAGLAESLGGVPIRLAAADRALYHAAAVIASNYLVTLASLAASLYRETGIDSDEALRALLPLVKGTVGNLERVGLPASLTGPIARGDVGTIRRHVAALGERVPEIAEVYRALGAATIDIATAKGTLDASTAEEVAELIRSRPGHQEVERRKTCSEPY